MKSKQNPREIIRQIQSLLGELSGVLGHEMTSTASSKGTASQKPVVFSGPSGGIRLLLSEGFFKQPKTLPEVYARVRQEGFNYRQQAVAVALLRLVRDRTMVRLPSDGEGKERWAYSERK
ncbi:MAG: hypothetical protein AAB480_02380 [Patescibacteria group bacterium]